MFQVKVLRVSVSPLWSFTNEFVLTPKQSMNYQLTPLSVLLYSEMVSIHSVHKGTLKMFV